MIFIFLEIKSPCGYCYMGLPGLKWLCLPISVKIPKQNQNQKPLSLPSIPIWKCFFLVRMCHTFYVRVSPSMVLRPREEKSPLFSIFPSAWPFGSCYWRGLDAWVAAQSEKKDGSLLCFFCSSAAPAKTLLFALLVDWFQWWASGIYLCLNSWYNCSHFYPLTSGI